MEVIFDTHMLKPVLSPTMKTALSVLGLIGRSLVEANKCMKERVATETGQPPTLDDVMKQSGLHIPGLEEALAQFMGGGDEAKKAAALVVNTPDPVTLLNRFAAAFGVEPATAPIVTPPPASAANAAPPTRATGPLAGFRTDFTREARDAARAAAPSSEPPGLPLFRQDFTREARDAARAAATQPAPPQPATPSPTPTRAAPPSLVAGVKLRLDALRCEKQAHEATVSERITRLEARLAALHAEWRQYCDAQARGETTPASDVPVQLPEGPASAQVGDLVAIDEPASALAAPSGATGDGVVIDEPAPQPAITPAPADTAIEPEPLPTAANTEEVVQAFELIDEYAEQARAADEQQLARIAALEQDVGRMEGLVQHARAAHEVTAAHAQ